MKSFSHAGKLHQEAYHQNSFLSFCWKKIVKLVWGRILNFWFTLLNLIIFSQKLFCIKHIHCAFRDTNWISNEKKMWSFLSIKAVNIFILCSFMNMLYKSENKENLLSRFKWDVKENVLIKEKHVWKTMRKFAANAFIILSSLLMLATSLHLPFPPWFTSS